MATPPPSWMIRSNVALLRRGLKVGSQYLLTVPGRNSRVPRSTPISVVSAGGPSLVGARRRSLVGDAVHPGGEGGQIRHEHAQHEVGHVVVGPDADDP